jgi:ABC-2 type transport system permease protein
LRMLSGSTSPLSSMPNTLSTLLQASPTVHFVNLAQAVLFRDAGLMTVWPEIAKITGLGAVFLLIALSRFRAMLARQR